MPAVREPRGKDGRAGSGCLTRRDFLRGAGIAALSMMTGCSVFGGMRRKTNVIFILADDLGYGDLGCYGQELIQTPNLDTVAAEGMRFTQAYSGGAVCAPARCCLLTGLHTGHARIRDNSSGPLRPEDVTVAELLKAADYTTAAIGKWGLSEAGTTGVPNEQGFDEWFGYLDQKRAHNYYPEFLWKDQEKYWIEENRDGRKGVYSHDLFTEGALDFIRRNRDQPFFLYLAYTVPHANNQLGKATGNGMEVPSDEPYSDQPWPQPEKNFAAMVTRLDRDVGRMLALLKELKIDEDTVLFFSSDNGPHSEGEHSKSFFKSGGPLRSLKRYLWEGGIRVPMLVRWPGKIEPATVSDQVWAFWDFLPTAVEITGGELPEDIDGISILPTLLGQPQLDHEYLYWEYPADLPNNTQQAVRMGDWKGILHSQDDKIELYNLSDDIGEEHDVAAEHPEIVEEIAHIMQIAHTDSLDHPITESTPE